MPTLKKRSAPSSSRVSLGHERAPYGFVFFFLLVAAVFAFSTFYVISESAREVRMQRDVLEITSALQERVDLLQTQVNRLSAQNAVHQALLEQMTTGTVPRVQTR